MDIAGVNAPVLYNSNPDNLRTLRKVFLKNLAMAVMKLFFQEMPK